MRLFIISTIAVFLGLTSLALSAYVTDITAFPDYSAARECVQYAASVGVGAFGWSLGCQQQTSITCLCGSIGDVSQSITSWIFSIASSNCGDDIEATSAVGIFAEYCGQTTAAAVVATPTAGVATTNTPAPANTATAPESTQTSSTNNNNNNNNIIIKSESTTTHPIPINIIVGVTVPVVVLSVLALWWFYARNRTRRLVVTRANQVKPRRPELEKEVVSSSYFSDLAARTHSGETGNAEVFGSASPNVHEIYGRGVAKPIHELHV